ncbi:cyclopropane-fatty-acyl-phospholipid synthase [Renibacterium salmoninarum ATCC 33209]|uniref:Cyclopropane-fatty-acyl-phospholipid synthase n=1 Tax=Renibacterium salmoninarum (strain ATCC 33209 / DSM 20767 / JCM 11484 / NBRC 15589 / NCIMB 2235) TaxID=288705 RepID=A9WVG8_RENSM|nr:cyclopropane-fatty-acyl-phospholipid synthase family protein [Renibacterium salmoninarum]ABY25189.1 cyclopropane-fatty-acyl-phospholipid synthase [Renibacterium salmoninarum ATCC 33209]
MIAQELAALLEPLVGGELPVRIRSWDGSSTPEKDHDDRPVVKLNSPAVLRRQLWGPGELALSQSYVLGELEVSGGLYPALRQVWEVVQERELSAIKVTPALLGKLARLARSAGAIGPRLAAPDSQAKLVGRLHSKLRDKRAIGHHYDLSNDFYALILDERLAYSSGYWGAGAQDVHQAQGDKCRLVGEKLGLKLGMRVLDIGCGWGSLSIELAELFDVQMVGVTISVEQRAFAQERARQRGVSEQVEIRLQDYREITGGPFDAVVSLEMGEHVGQKNYGTYAQVVKSNLKPGAPAVIQQMSRHGKYPGGGPFIEGFIAPDMHMRPLGETLGFFEQVGLEIEGVQSLRKDYVQTIAAWRETFDKRFDDAVAMMGLEVAKVWELYLAGGELTFAQGRMGVEQILMRRT